MINRVELSEWKLRCRQFVRCRQTNTNVDHVQFRYNAALRNNDFYERKKPSKGKYRLLVSQNYSIIKLDLIANMEPVRGKNTGMLCNIYFHTGASRVVLLIERLLAGKQMR